MGRADVDKMVSSPPDAVQAVQTTTGAAVTENQAVKRDATGREPDEGTPSKKPKIDSENKSKSLLVYGTKILSICS